MADLTIEQRVANGVAWLDDRIPNWAYRISLLDFDMRDDCNCVVGQVIGHYGKVVDGVDVPKDNVISLAEAVERGFDAGTRVDSTGNFDSDSGVCQAEFEALQAEWVRVIASRREVVPDA